MTMRVWIVTETLYNIEIGGAGVHGNSSVFDAGVYFAGHGTNRKRKHKKYNGVYCSGVESMSGGCCGHDFPINHRGANFGLQQFHCISISQCLSWQHFSGVFVLTHRIWECPIRM